MAVFFRFNDKGEIEVCKKMFSSVISKEEFEKGKKVMPDDLFLSQCNPELRKNIEHALSMFKELRITARKINEIKQDLSFDGVSFGEISKESFGPRICRDIDHSYYVDSFFVGERQFVVASGSPSQYVSNLEEVKKEIMEYGKKVFGQEFVDAVKERNLLDFDMVSNRNFGISPSNKYNEFIVSKKQREKLEQIGAEKLKDKKETLRKLNVKYDELYAKSKVICGKIKNFNELNMTKGRK